MYTEGEKMLLGSTHKTAGDKILLIRPAVVSHTNVDVFDYQRGNLRRVEIMISLFDHDLNERT